MLNYRLERIERLLEDLRREIEIGIMQNEIDEHLGMQWAVPISRVIPKGVVLCKFETRPAPAHVLHFSDMFPRLKLISGGKEFPCK